jgi:O-antigen/teichoic acid export membrane protein
MGFKKTFLKNISVFGGYSYLTWIFDTLISTVILSRFLGPKEYGFVALITIFSGFIVLFSNTGLSYAVIRSPYGRVYQKIIFSLSIWIGFILFVLLALLAYPITLIYSNNALFWPTIVVAVQFLTNAFTIVPSAILEKRFEFNYLGLTQFIVTVLNISIMIAMAALGCSYWSLIIPSIFQPLFKYLMLEWKVKFGFHLYGWEMTKRGYKKVRSLMESISIFNFVNYFARNADNFAVGRIYGESNLGLYDRGYKFIYMARRLINTVLSPVLVPSLNEAKRKGEDYRSHFLDIIGMINFINILIIIPLVLFAKPLTLILWGKAWIGVADFLPYVGALIPLQTLQIAAMDLYLIDNREKAYLTLGIPTSLILVAGIFVGAFFSPLGILRCYSLAFFFVQVPVSLYFGHYRILKFTTRQLMIFWGPKLILSIALLFSIWFGGFLSNSIILGLCFVENILFKSSDYKDLYKLARSKITGSLKKSI